MRKSTINTNIPPNHLDLDRTYVLSYVYDGDFRNQKTMTFSGAEIQKALDTLPEALLCGDFAENMKKMLHTNIIVGGRLLLNKPLLEDHPEQTINMMKLANDGDEEAMRTVRFGFATYLGLNINKIIEDDIDAWEMQIYLDDSLFFVFDTDYNGPLLEVTEEALAEADAMMEQCKVRQHPSRLKAPATGTIYQTAKPEVAAHQIT